MGISLAMEEDDGDRGLFLIRSAPTKYISQQKSISEERRVTCKTFYIRTNGIGVIRITRSRRIADTREDGNDSRVTGRAAIASHERD